MNTLKTLIAAAALATVSTASFAADDSPAAKRVQHNVSDSVIHGSAQHAPTAQATFAETGMSTAAGRFQVASGDDEIRGHDRSIHLQEFDVANDSGDSVAGTRVRHAVSDVNV
ncbi:hypothetical protein [Cobetia sp. AM6]|uniref:hypothetical protein n=1 Tax=Cobetia sp. AM6 TaxID=2661553 RepID=UPI001298F8CA|nr:hypothetical protein [Cobetia sp. AM6]BBO56026.1 hypothetical protein CLAM6_13370 [Cobetia sp. AM6]